MRIRGPLAQDVVQFRRDFHGAAAVGTFQILHGRIPGIKVQDRMPVAIGTVAHDVFVSAVLRKGDVVVMLAVFIVVTFFIAGPACCVHP